MRRRLRVRLCRQASPSACFRSFVLSRFPDDSLLEKETQISREYRRLIEDDLPPRDLPSERRGDAAQQIVPHTSEDFDFALETRPIEQIIAVDLEFIGVRRAAYDDVADELTCARRRVFCPCHARAQALDALRDALLVLVEELRLVRRREFAVGLALETVVPRRHHVAEAVGQERQPFP